MKYYNFFDVLQLNVSGSVQKFFNDLFSSYEMTNRNSKVVLNVREKIIEPNGIKTGKRMVFNQKWLFLRDDSSNWCQIDLREKKLPVELRYSRKFNAVRLSKIAEWIMHLHLSKYGIAFVHSMGFVKNGKARLAIAWKGTGKTGAFLELLQEGYCMLGDDWTVVDAANAEILPYLKSCYIYKKDLLNAPSLALSNLLKPNRLSIPIYRMLSELGKGGKVLEMCILRRIESFRFPMIMHFSEDKKLLAERIPVDKCFLVKRYSSKDVELKQNGMNGAVALDELERIYRYELSQFVDDKILAYAVGEINPVPDHLRRVRLVYRRLIEKAVVAEIVLPEDTSGGKLVKILLQ